MGFGNFLISQGLKIFIDYKDSSGSKNFGDMYNTYAGSEASGDKNTEALSFSELTTAINDNMGFKQVGMLGSLFGLPDDYSPSTEEVSSGIWSMLNSDDDNEHITKDEIRAFLEGSNYTYEDLAEGKLDRAVGILLEVAVGKI